MKFTHSLWPTSPRSTSVLQFFSLPIPDHWASILNPGSRFLIPDPVFPKPKRKGNDDHDHAQSLTHRVFEEVMSLRRKTNLVPSVFLFSGKREDPWDEAGHFMDSDWAYRM